jgi:serine protease Do
MAEAFNLERPVGALVNEVNEGSAADQAGIEPGDVILEFNGIEVESSGDLPPLVGANPPGTEADIVVSRNGTRRTFTVVLDALEEEADDERLAADAGGERSNALGLQVEPIGAEQRRALGDPAGGVLVSRVESDAAYRAGLRRGDVILAINNQAVEDVESFEEQVASLTPGKAVAVRIMREGVTRFIAFTPAIDD